MNIFYYSTVKGLGLEIGLASSDGVLCFVGTRTHFAEWLIKNFHNYRVVESERIMSVYSNQISEYLIGKRKDFSFNVVLFGSDFQISVWKALSTIGYGETTSYRHIAGIINNHNAVRAVGTAIGSNPVCIVIPCHRVIQINGDIGNYRYGVDMKEKLLRLEVGELNA